MNQKLYSTEKASELSGLGTETINKLIEIGAVIPVNDNLISSFGLERLKKISELLEQGYSQNEIINELDEYQ